MNPSSDYHTHPQGHRVQPYMQELLQPWVDSARARGITVLAFTDHDRYREGVDFDEIDRMRERNADINIRAGIELDNDPVHSPAGRRWIENYQRLSAKMHSLGVSEACIFERHQRKAVALKRLPHL